MARMGIFSRNDDTPERVPRSVQMLNRRYSCDTKYMQIVPNFVQYMYPNESIKIRVTNLVKSIPLNTPQLSNIRIVQRFVAVPLRLLWFAWEDYIKGENDSAFVYEEPYIVNNITTALSMAQEQTAHTIPRGVRYHANTTGQTIFFPREFKGNTGTDKGFVPSGSEGQFVGKYGETSGSTVAFAQFRPHELGDYFGAPLYVPFGKVSDTYKKNWSGSDQVFSAFPFAAYQLAYSYFYRAPNVQTRVDDYYQMQHSYDMSGEREFTKGVAEMVTRTPSETGTGESDVKMINLSEDSLKTGMNGFDTDNAALSTDFAKWLTSWDKVEHFPLKSGANWSMLACRPDSVSGLPQYRPSQISLFRKRYANWQTDNFTACNPWQQRGDEVQIPVNGEIVFNTDSAQVTILPKGTVTSTFTGITDSHAILLPGHVTVGPNVGEYVTSGSSYTIAPRSPSATPGEFVGDTVTVEVSGSSPITPRGTVVSNFEGTSETLPISLNGNAVSNLYVSPSSMKFALALQHVKELQAQIDNRYQSYIKKFFGARARDYRLDRPEFIGGMVQNLNVSEVIQQSQSTNDSPLGTQAGLASSAKTSHSIRYHAEEHTIVLGLIHIIPDTEYIGGLDQEFNTKSRFDWMLPNFAHVAEQPVPNSSLALTPFGEDNTVGYDPVTNKSYVSMDGAFGYEPVYNYLRWTKSQAVGAFRDTLNSLGSYEYYKPWLFTRDFGWTQSHSASRKLVINSPTLTDKFLSGRYGVDYSNFAVTDPEVMYPFMLDSYFNVRMVRTIPSRGLPSKV